MTTPSSTTTTSTTTTTGATTSAPTSAATGAETLREVAATYRTCELATLTRAGVPVAWPAVCVVGPGPGGSPGSITLTTSVALPRKALNVRSDPRVALLFSDPTGTGRTDLPQVHVAGTATCPEEIRTSPAGLEDYWLRLWERQPDAVATSVPLLRRSMDFYFFRLVITVTPEQVEARSPLARPAARPDAPAGAAAAPARDDRSAWADAVRRLPAYEDAVLGLAPGPDALPVLHRVRVEADPQQRRLRLHPGAGEVPAGPEGTRASLLFHAHDDRLGALRQHVVLGTVLPDRAGAEGTLSLRPDRVVPGPVPGSALETLRTLVRLRRATRSYLAERGLSRPAVDWAAFERLKRTRPSSGGAGAGS